jgi:hypothetical protein
MELAEFLSSALPEEDAQGLFELAAADPSIFCAELLSWHRSGRLHLPTHLLKAVARDLGQLGGE